MSDFGRVSENKMLVHGLEANLKAIEMMKQKFLLYNKYKYLIFD